MEQVNGYSLKKQKLKQWIYEHKLSQPLVARKLRMPLQEMKDKLTKRDLFNEKQIKDLVYLMGAEEAFKVIYFPTKEERERVFSEVFANPLKIGVKR